MKNKLVIMIGICIVGLAAVTIYQLIRFSDKKLHVVICDVGQGDAIFIRTPTGDDILVDGGPDNSVLNCLASHMPFWDRSLEVVFLTHPDADHITGLVSVLKSYHVNQINREPKENPTLIDKEFESTVHAEQVPVRMVETGDHFSLDDGISIHVLWPSHSMSLTADGPTPSNNYSIIDELQYRGFSLLLTGDIDTADLDAISPQIGRVSILKMPHHGSKTGSDATTFQYIHPDLAVISVGKDNRYGLPSPSVLSILNQDHIPYLRTDEGGEIEIISDGNKFSVER